jgi:lysyl-tRNA synthetase class 2
MSDSLRRQRLQFRGELLARLRAFFAERGFLEVETPLVDDEIIPELHIEPFPVVDSDRRTPLWLQASPELHMKRLLAEGLPAIYQATRSFRQGERGRLHNPEFTIVEWYRAGDDYLAGIDLLCELVERMSGTTSPIVRTTYRDAFVRYAGVDPFVADEPALAAAAARLGIAVPAGMHEAPRDPWLNLILATTVEPNLGAAGPEILCDYPASQAALATTARRAHGCEVAERFELYWRGVELANGYHELCDSQALRRRLEQVNAERASAGRTRLPLPERLLAAMERPGLPPCSGCALGFDRLAMLLSGAESIDDVLAFVQNDSTP